MDEQEYGGRRSSRGEIGMTATLELLRSLVRINSVFPNEATLSRYMQGLLRERGFSVVEVMSEGHRPNFVATFGEAFRYVAFYGHLDTVPPDPLFSFDPFEMRTDDTNAYGLGVADMKGGNACILVAAFCAADKGLPVKVVFGVDEENISQGAHDLVSSGHLSDVACMVVAEAGQVEDFSQPFSVGFGRKGRVAFEAKIYGTLSHAAVATPETNAINRAAAFVRVLESLSFPTHHALGSTRVVPHALLSEASAFSAPGECLIRFSALTTPGVTGEALGDQIRERASLEGLRVDLNLVERKTPYGEAYEVSLEHPWVRAVTERVIAPAEVTPAYFSSVADENVFARRLNIPVITLGPIGAGDHTKDEWVRLSSLGATLRAYEEILRLWCSPQVTC
jgi:acetylornithine deacetylase/succinyl-diaminopimelate desuccinylase-like protein